MKWSYSPKWKDDMNLINCRHETLLEKPSLRDHLDVFFLQMGGMNGRGKITKTPFSIILKMNCCILLVFII